MRIPKCHLFFFLIYLFIYLYIYIYILTLTYIYILTELLTIVFEVFHTVLHKMVSISLLGTIVVRNMPFESHPIRFFRIMNHSLFTEYLKNQFPNIKHLLFLESIQGFDLINAYIVTPHCIMQP